MRITFNEIAVRETVRWRDPVTGRSRQLTKKFFQTINPFNRDDYGQPKSSQQIRDELRSEAYLWKLSTENDIRDGKFPA